MRSALLALWAVPLAAQVYPAGPQVVTLFSNFDDSDQPYGLYVPRSFDPSRKYPLVIGLHGENSNHRLQLRRIFGRGNRPGETDTEASRYFPPFPDVDFIVATPFARGSMGYRGIAEAEVYEVLEDVKRRFPIDEDRVYLTGLSMGGEGALRLALTRPDIWAAVASICPRPSQETQQLAGNAANLPVKLFHGAQDPLTPVAVSREWKKQFESNGVKVEYAEYPSVRHNSWDPAYRNAEIFSWFEGHKRSRFPESVHFRTAQYKYARAYWIEITGLTPGDAASIDATFTAPNQLRISTSGLFGFRLNLQGHPMFSASKPLDLSVDGRALVTKALSFSKRGDTWQPQVFGPQPVSKIAGLEGALAEAISSRHIYVYGTDGFTSPADIEQRRRNATAAATWTAPHTPVFVNLRVVADRELSEADFRTSNLILFGTRETNSVVRRLAARLPFHLNAGAADYGLLYIWPNGNQYVVVNSGLPFTLDSEYTKRLPFQLLEPLGDFVLFRGSLENIVVEGRFDVQWRVPAESRERMQATGAIEALSPHTPRHAPE